MTYPTIKLLDQPSLGDDSRSAAGLNSFCSQLSHFSEEDPKV
jgi:hypothetical protein